MGAHRVGLATAGLSIGQDGRVVPTQAEIEEIFAWTFVDLVLIIVFVENMVELEDSVKRIDLKLFVINF